MYRGPNRSSCMACIITAIWTVRYLHIYQNEAYILSITVLADWSSSSAKETFLQFIGTWGQIGKTTTGVAKTDWVINEHNTTL